MLLYLFTDLDRLSPAFVQRCLNWLPPQPASHINAVKSNHARTTRTTAHLLLLHALYNWGQGTCSQSLQWLSFEELDHIARRGEQQDLAMPQPTLHHGPHGKPYLVGDNAPHFNISHCQHAVAVAMHQHEIGIDIEQRRNVSPTLIRKVCNDDEQQQIAHADDATMEFLRLWTRKESFVKQTGTGLTVPLPHLLDSLPKHLQQATILHRPSQTLLSLTAHHLPTLPKETD